MNTERSDIEAYFTEAEPLKTELTCCLDVELTTREDSVRRTRAKYNLARPYLAPVFNELEAQAASTSIDATEANISVAGDKDILLQFIRCLRKHGFSTESTPPQKGQTSWVSRWRHPKSPMGIWFSFSSTVCRQVQVGTEMKEVPIYQVQCGEPLSIDEPAAPQIEDQSEGAVITLTE